MTLSASHERSSRHFRERLAPGPWLFIALLLVIPAAILTIVPVAAALAVPVAIAVYLILAGVTFLASPIVTVEEGMLTAGRARIPVNMLGDIEVLDKDRLRAAIGPGMDARSHLVVRGYIHLGVKIEVTDPADPTPYWIITTRRPGELKAALLAAR